MCSEGVVCDCFSKGAALGSVVYAEQKRFLSQRAERAEQERDKESARANEAESRLGAEMVAHEATRQQLAGMEQVYAAVTSGRVTLEGEAELIARAERAERRAEQTRETLEAARRVGDVMLGERNAMRARAEKAESRVRKLEGLLLTDIFILPDCTAEPGSYGKGFRAAYVYLRSAAGLEKPTTGSYGGFHAGMEYQRGTERPPKPAGPRRVWVCEKCDNVYHHPQDHCRRYEMLDMACGGRLTPYVEEKP